MHPDQCRCVRFGVFEVDLRSGELRKAGRRLPLQEQPFRLLARLLQHPGDVVTREELRAQLWSTDTFVDFEHGLNAAMKRLRDTLGDSAENPVFIETLPRRGYRFVAPVAEPGGAIAPSETVKTSAARAGRHWVAAAAIAAGVLGGVSMAVATLHRGSALTDRDTILVADFVNHTGDDVFDGTLRQALTIQLEQSPYLSLVSRERIKRTLQQMTRSPAEALAGAVLFEACRRLGATAAVTGTITLAGARYVIGVDVVNCASGESMGAEQVEAADREHVLDAVSTAAFTLRRRLGESRATAARFDMTLRQATTASLEALKAFSVAEDIRDREGDTPAESFYRRAIEIDPDFALAYARLSAIAFNARRLGEMRSMADQANARRDRVSERERLYIDYRVCVAFMQASDCIVNNLELWKHTFPRDGFPRSGLCDAYQNDGEFAKALADCLEAERLDPDNVFAQSQLIASYMSLNRFAEAARAADAALARHLTAGLHQQRYLIAFVAGDRAVMTNERTALAAHPENAEFAVIESEAAAFAGHLEESRAHRRRADRLAAGRQEYQYEIRAFGELLDVSVGVPSRWSSDAPLLPPGVWLASRDAIIASLILKDQRRSQALLKPFLAIPQLQRPPNLEPALVLLAINEGDPSAIERMPPPAPRELGPFFGYRPIYIRGLAYLHAGDGTRAAAEFQRILDHRGLRPTSPLYVLAHVQQGRAYAMAGDRLRARLAYHRFLNAWKDADSGIPLLDAARNEYAALTASGPALLRRP